MTKVNIKAALQAGMAGPPASLQRPEAAEAEPRPSRRRVVRLIRAVARRLRPIVGRVATYLLHPAIERIDQAATLRDQAAATHRQEHDQLIVLLESLRATQADRLNRLEGAHHLLNQRFDEFERLGAILKAQGEARTAEVSYLTAQVQGIAMRQEALPGMFGPRFDELEIKLRPPIAYDERHVAVRLRDGYVLVPKAEPRFLTMVANATSEGLEPGTRQVLARLIAPGMTVADVGANIGLLTVACARAAGPTGLVYAFEPEVAMHDALAETLILNGLSWVRLRQEAVGREAGQATFHVSPVPGHSSLYPLPDGEGARSTDVPVKVVRLDDVVPPTERLDVIKIDVEGAELDVLAGAQRTLADNPDIAIVVEFGPSHLQRCGISPDEWFQAFTERGLHAFAIVEPSGQVRPTVLSDVQEVDSVNLVFVRRGSASEARLTS